jgi:hypothetical protein
MVRPASFFVVSCALALSACEAPEANKAYAAQLEATVAALKQVDADKAKADAEAVAAAKERLTSTWATDGAVRPLDLPEGATVNAALDAGRKVVTVEGPGKPEDAAVVLSSVARHPALKLAAMGRMWVAEGKFAITLVEHEPPPLPATGAAAPARPARSGDDALEKRIDQLEAEQAELAKLLNVDIAALERDRAWVASAEKALEGRPTPDGAFFAWLHRQLLSQDARVVRAVVTCIGAGGCELELEAEGPTAGALLEGPLKAFLGEMREMKPGTNAIVLKTGIKTPTASAPSP